MLAAHLVPGYFAAAKSQSSWKPDWNKTQRVMLWATTLGSTVVPDLDVVYNALFRGFFNHSTLWTHSIFVYLGFGLVWLILHITKRWAYIETLTGLVAVGGLSHLVLDIIAHGTPMLYPVSMMIFGIAPQRVIEGGVWAYLTDPIFLLEPLLFSIAIIHWTHHQDMTPYLKKVVFAATISGLLMFTIVFALSLPTLQRAVLPLLPL